jgi:hypothetical protein
MNQTLMNLLLVFVLATVAVSSQDVSVPKDLLGTTKKPSSSTVSDVIYGDLSEETTDDEIEETTNDENGFEGTTNTPPADSLTRPQFPLPPFESNCTIQLPPYYYPPNQPPIIIAPIVNETVGPVEREETVVCPVGLEQIGNVCNDPTSNKCPKDYTFDGKRCVIKFTNCPLNFDFNEVGQCVERQLCPHNHVWKNGRCQPVTLCPTGWRWNGERCEVIRIECPPDTIFRDNECVSEIFTCPLGFTKVGENCIQPKRVCPSGYEMKENGFCSRVTLRCPENFSLINNECRKRVTSCPKGTQQVGDQCFQIQTERPHCPPGFRLVGDMCNLIPTEKPKVPEIICPPGTFKVGFVCYYYKTATDKPVIMCPPDFVLAGDVCLSTLPSDILDCPDGYYKFENECYILPPDQTTYRPKTCPPGYEFRENICVLKPVRCLPGFYDHNGYCYPITTQNPLPEKSTPRIVFPVTTPRHPSPGRCPEGFVYRNRQCYRCPKDFDLCEDRCIRGGSSCSHGNLPIINVNIFSRDGGLSGSGKFHNFINHIEPINNTIININNVTHPVTLNNVVENHIYIYTDAQCPDGSIRTIVVKNNETINGCLDMEKEDEFDNEVTDHGEGDHDENKKCCEIVTPRQCKKREHNQWICSHR